MAHDSRRNVTSNLIAGICIMAIGLVLVFDRLGLLEARELLRFWPVLLIVAGVVIMWQALRSDATGANHGAGERAGVTPGVVILLVLAFLLVSRADERRTPADADTAHLFAIMSRDERISLATNFTGGGMTSIMGRTHLDLRQASVPVGHDAVVDVVGVMGRVVLQVPPDWIVDVQAVTLMGEMKDERRPAARAADTAPLDPAILERDGPPATTAAPPRLVVKGVVLMGALSIR